ncbi:ComF family protein [Heyndrickxia acidiproducens]|uniref:ComF family protein n=1 Tax=Heyndrickxia acidiproducens TaxID=1121084 RepID=UPI00036FE29E|nr:ComF family protein [Heyndrickxia acidiproducens]
MNEFCLYCRQPIRYPFFWRTLVFPQQDIWLCDACRGKLKRISGPVCKICCRPLAKLDPAFIREGICQDCARWEEDAAWSGVLEKNTSLYEYNDFCKDVLAQFKFRGDYILSSIFADDIQKVLEHSDAELIVPIPLSPERLSERLFNQSEALAEAAGLQTVPLLKRTHSEKQSKKTRDERIHQEQVFQIEEHQPIQGVSVLLIDDIYTTGSTLRHAAKVLKTAGAAKVTSLTIARS